METVRQLPPEPLSKREEKILASSETDIYRNLRGFKEVGCALMVIRDQLLYRIDYDSFEEYCRLKWDMSRRRAYYLIDAYKVVDNLCTMVHKTTHTPSDDLTTIVDVSPKKTFEILPANERQARPLACFSAERQIAIWALVIEKSNRSELPVTALLVQQCAHDLSHTNITKKINDAKSSTRREKAVPELIQKTYNNFLEMVQKQADSNWKDVNRKQMAEMLRGLIEIIEI